VRGWLWRLGSDLETPRFFLILCAVFLIAGLGLGCAKTVKGPVGQGDKGVGLKVPVLDLLKKDTYSAESLSPDNIEPEQFNPAAGEKDKAPQSEPFSRYDETMN
jgi:hypothetical protein